MKAKLLLLLCCLFAIEGWANSNDIHLLKDSRSNPMGILFNLLMRNVLFSLIFLM